MKRTTQIAVATLTLAVFWAGSAPAAHASACSTQTVAGKWAGTLSGMLLLPTGPVPVAAIIRATIDGEGNFTGTEARSVGGGYADETFIGKWTVNPDCTGAATASFYQDGQLVRVSALAAVFDDNAKEFRMVQQSLTLPDGTTQLPVVITVEARKQ